MPEKQIDRLSRLLSIWAVHEVIQRPTPSWASEVPEVERNALKAALAERYVPNPVIAQKLVEQARELKANPETAESAERLFVLAAMKGAVDIDELTIISQVSRDSDLKERARKNSIVAGASGKPYKQLVALGAPLPDSHTVFRYAGRDCILGCE